MSRVCKVFTSLPRLQAHLEAPQRANAEPMPKCQSPNITLGQGDNFDFDLFAQRLAIVDKTEPKLTPVGAYRNMQVLLVESNTFTSVDDIPADTSLSTRAHVLLFGMLKPSDTCWVSRSSVRKLAQSAQISSQTVSACLRLLGRQGYIRPHLSDKHIDDQVEGFRSRADLRTIAVTQT